MTQCSFSIRGGQMHCILIILIINIIVSYDQNISLIIYVKVGSHVRLPHPSCVYITAQWQYTAVQKMHTPSSEITFLALNPWFDWFILLRVPYFISINGVFHLVYCSAVIGVVLRLIILIHRSRYPFRALLHKTISVQSSF